MLQNNIEMIMISYFLWFKKFFLTYVLEKMLTLDLYSHFLLSITLANFHQILKVMIILKSELSWFSENVQNFDPRCLRSWEARCPKFCETPCRAACALKNLFSGWELRNISAGKNWSEAKSQLELRWHSSAPACLITSCVYKLLEKSTFIKNVEIICFK